MFGVFPYDDVFLRFNELIIIGNLYTTNSNLFNVSSVFIVLICN